MRAVAFQQKEFGVKEQVGVVILTDGKPTWEDPAKAAFPLEPFMDFRKGRRVSPSDGEEYLTSLANRFANPYFWVEIQS